MSRRIGMVEMKPGYDIELLSAAEEWGAESEKLVAIDASMKDRLHSLVAGVDVDLDAPLSPDDE